MKPLIILVSLLLVAFSAIKVKKPHSSSFFMSSSFSSFSAGKDGEKPHSQVRSMKTEEFRDQDGDRPEKVRKYGEFFSKDNDKPALLKKKANTNVEEEEVILKTSPEESKTLNKSQEQQFFKGFDNSFGNFFGGEDDFPHLGANMFKNFEKQFQSQSQSLDAPIKSHGNYDKFLHEREDKLINKVKHAKK
jgi:hypothetical protein